MTLIVGYTINCCPVLLGDVLLSQQKPVGGDISVPTWHNDQLAPRENPLRMTGLVQKINIISDHVCMAWAGSHIRAQTIARELRDHVAQHGANAAKLGAFLNTYDRADLRDLESIIYVVEDGILKPFHLRAPAYEIDGWTLQSGGTGVEHFISKFGHFFKLPAADDRSEAAVVGPGLSYIAAAFGEQLFTGGGLAEGWGGAFELATFRQGRFQKLDDILYVFWSAQKHADESITVGLYPSLVKTNYFGDTLAVHVSDQTGARPQTRIYNVAPLGQADEARHQVPLTYSYLINYFFIERNDGAATAATIVTKDSHVAGFRVERNANGIELQFDDLFVRRLCAQAFGPGTVITPARAMGSPHQPFDNDI